MQLPPKRYQSDQDTKYDSIRHLPWFYTLAPRREKIPLLECAAGFSTQKYGELAECAERWGVDEKELRGFIAARSGQSTKPSPVFQRILDYSYEIYCLSKGSRALTKIIYEASPFFGVNPRHVVELWEVDPAFYPSNYTGFR